jgi:hypothetical protein
MERYPDSTRTSTPDVLLKPNTTALPERELGVLAKRHVAGNRLWLKSLERWLHGDGHRVSPHVRRGVLVAILKAPAPAPNLEGN